MSPRASKKAEPLDAYAEAIRALSERDPKLGAFIARIGPCLLPAPTSHDGDVYFRGLVKAIVSQQLSGKAAATIFARVEALTPSMNAKSLMAIPVENLRGAGLSGSKAAFVRDLAERVLAGTLDLDGIRALDDDAVINALTAVKGVGRWTAQMFLMFHLGRPDVFAPDDLGLRKGVACVVRARKPIDRARLERIAAAWKPHRSVASWYLWRISELDDDGTR